jgi:hypothetical protein
VDAAWRRLLNRAEQGPGVPMTDDADMYLLVDGRRFDAELREAAAWIFHVPAAPAEIRIVSRCGVPQELGISRDPRSLGVGIRRIAFRHGTRFRIYTASDRALTDGFHAFEPASGMRWTNGDAAIPARLWDAFTGPLEIVLHLGGSTLYLDEGMVQRAA